MSTMAAPPEIAADRRIGIPVPKCALEPPAYDERTQSWPSLRHLSA